MLALLQAQWTYTGYDASAHMAEETIMARRSSAWGIVLSVGVSAMAGYLLLMILTWCIPNGDVAATANDPYPVLYIVSNNLTPVLANAIAIVIGVAMWLCGVASVTSMGRMWYAFARDDGMPGARWLKRLSGTPRTPWIPFLVTCALRVAISFYAAAWFLLPADDSRSLKRVLGAGEAAGGCVRLVAALGVRPGVARPVARVNRFPQARTPKGSRRRRGTGEFMTREVAHWSLGRWSPAVNAIAIAWIAIITIIFMLPPNELVLWTMIAVAIVLTLHWRLSARDRFAGPPKMT